MMLQLPQLAFDAQDTISPILRAAETIADKLRSHCSHFSEVTVNRLHRGTRVYRLLDLGEEYENLALVNIFNASRTSAARVLEAIVQELNGDPDIGFKVRFAPRGYLINGTDISSVAYVIGLLVYTSDQLDQPYGVVFVQTYTTDRSSAATLKSSSDEYEVE